MAAMIRAQQEKAKPQAQPPTLEERASGKPAGRVQTHHHFTEACTGYGLLSYIKLGFEMPITLAVSRGARLSQRCLPCVAHFDASGSPAPSMWRGLLAVPCVTPGLLAAELWFGAGSKPRAAAHAGSVRNKAAAAAVSRRYDSAAAAFADGLPPPDTSHAPAFAADPAPKRDERSEKKVRHDQRCSMSFSHG